MTKKLKKTLLLGNSFPLGLIRRRAVFTPLSLAAARKLARTYGIVSFWGHPATQNAAGNILGMDITPTQVRPALRLSKEKFPLLYGRKFERCLLLCPEYEAGFRPAADKPVRASKIKKWRAILIKWPVENPKKRKNE